jgi:hypothetical protein
LYRQIIRERKAKLFVSLYTLDLKKMLSNHLSFY